MEPLKKTSFLGLNTIFRLLNKRLSARQESIYAVASKKVFSEILSFYNTYLTNDISFWHSMSRRTADLPTQKCSMFCVLKCLSQTRILYSHEDNFSDSNEARFLERFDVSIPAENPNYQLIFNRFCQDQLYHRLGSWHNYLPYLYRMWCPGPSYSPGGWRRITQPGFTACPHYRSAPLRVSLIGHSNHPCSKIPFSVRPV